MIRNLKNLAQSKFSQLLKNVFIQNFQKSQLKSFNTYESIQILNGKFINKNMKQYKHKLINSIEKSNNPIFYIFKRNMTTQLSKMFLSENYPIKNNLIFINPKMIYNYLQSQKNYFNQQQEDERPKNPILQNAKDINKKLIDKNEVIFEKKFIEYLELGEAKKYEEALKQMISLHKEVSVCYGINSDRALQTQIEIIKFQLNIYMAQHGKEDDTGYGLPNKIMGIDANDFQEAKDLFMKIKDKINIDFIKKGPVNEYYYALFGKMYQIFCEPKETIEFLEKGLSNISAKSSKTVYWELLQAVALEYNGAGNTPLSVMRFKQALELKQTYWLQMNLGMLVEGNEPLEAINHFKKALELAEKELEKNSKYELIINNFIGIIYEKLNQKEEATKAFKAGADSYSQNNFIQEILNAPLQQVEETDENIRSDYMKKAELLCQISETYLKIEEYEKAYPFLEKTLSYAKQGSVADNAIIAVSYKNLGIYMYKTNKVEESITLLTKAKEILVPIVKKQEYYKIHLQFIDNLLMRAYAVIKLMNTHTPEEVEKMAKELEEDEVKPEIDKLLDLSQDMQMK